MGVDGPGRHRSNPIGAAKVTEKDVDDLAADLEVRVRRDTRGAWSMWWVVSPEGSRWTLGETNRLAVASLRRYDADGDWPWLREGAGITPRP